jgi:hypothetical protein
VHRSSPEPGGAGAVEDRPGRHQGGQQAHRQVDGVDVLGRGDAQHPVDQLEPVDLLLRRPAASPASPRDVGVDQRPGPLVRVRDGPGGEVQPSEQLMRRQVEGAAVDVPEPGGHRVLEVEPEDVGLAVDEVQRHAGCEQRLLGGDQSRPVGHAEVAGRDQGIEPDRADEGAGGPPQGLDVAQASGAVLEVGLEHLGGVADLRPPLDVGA